MKTINFNILNLFFLLCCTIFFIGCSNDDEMDNNDLFKSSFNAENAYYQIISSSNAMDDFENNYTFEEKSAIWVFKFERYLNDKQLNSDEKKLVEDLRDLVSDSDFFERPANFEDDADSLENQINNLFGENSEYLLYSLENEPGDVQVDPDSGEDVSQRCLWCYEEVSDPENGDCMAQVDSEGNIIQFLRNNVKVRRVRLGIGFGTTRFDNVPCSYNDWIRDDMQIRELPH